MTEQNRNSARRNLLKSIVAGGGILATGRLLPESWSKPVVQAVMLPAHAQTTPPAGVIGGFGPAQSDDMAMNEHGRSIMDFFVQPAHAQGMAQVGNVSFDVFWTVRENDADICGQAEFLNTIATLSGTVGRSGDRLDDFSQVFDRPSPFDDVTLSFSNQQVSNSGVTLIASTDDPDNPSASLLAPPGGGCVADTSSPYADDEEEEIV